MILTERKVLARIRTLENELERLRALPETLQGNDDIETFEDLLDNMEKNLKIVREEKRLDDHHMRNVRLTNLVTDVSQGRLWFCCWFIKK